MKLLLQSCLPDRHNESQMGLVYTSQQAAVTPPGVFLKLHTSKLLFPFVKVFQWDKLVQIVNIWASNRVQGRKVCMCVSVCGCVYMSVHECVCE